MARGQWLFAFVLTVAPIVIGTDQSTAEDKIRIAWAGDTPANSPIWVVQDQALLRKEGLTGEVIRITNSPTAVQALLAGELDTIVTSVTTLASARMAGADVVMMLGVVPTFVDHIIAIHSITQVAQLKNKMGGVNRLGSTSDLGLRLALRRLGVDPQKDTKIITAGNNPERFAALTKGVIQYSIMPEPMCAKPKNWAFAICSTSAL